MKENQADETTAAEEAGLAAAAEAKRTPARPTVQDGVFEHPGGVVTDEAAAPDSYQGQAVRRRPQPNEE